MTTHGILVTYVADGTDSPTRKQLRLAAAILSRAFLNNAQEGVDWLAGRHEADSDEGRALLASYAIVHGVNE